MITKRKDLVIIDEIRKYMEENYNSEISIASLCKEFGINRTKLQEGFNQLFGQPIYIYLSQVRMDRAKALLAESDESVKVIAADCGYKSISGFSRAFTKLHRISPTQYRKQVLT